MAHATDTKALQQDAILSRMRQDAREIFQAGLQAAETRDAIRRHCHRLGNRHETDI